MRYNGAAAGLIKGGFQNLQKDTNAAFKAAGTTTESKRVKGSGLRPEYLQANPYNSGCNVSFPAGTTVRARGDVDIVLQRSLTAFNGQEYSLVERTPTWRGVIKPAQSTAGPCRCPPLTSASEYSPKIHREWQIPWAAM